MTNKLFTIKKLGFAKTPFCNKDINCSGKSKKIVTMHDQDRNY